MLDKNSKKRIIDKFKIHGSDTGSPQVQTAILTEEIKKLTEHLKSHKHDFSSRRGLLRKVGERRRLLKYLQKEDEQAFQELAQKLKLRIAKKMLNDEEEKKRRLEEETVAETEEKEEEEGTEEAVDSE